MSSGGETGHRLGAHGGQLELAAQLTDAFLLDDPVHHAPRCGQAAREQAVVDSQVRLAGSGEDRGLGHLGLGQIGRPRVVGARLTNPTTVLDDPATQWTPCRATGSDGSTAMVELTSGVALWYHGGQPSVHLRWVVVRHLEERRGPYALLCTDVEAEPLRILQWYLLRWQVEVAGRGGL